MIIEILNIEEMFELRYIIALNEIVINIEEDLTEMRKSGEISPEDEVCVDDVHIDLEDVVDKVHLEIVEFIESKRSGCSEELFELYSAAAEKAHADLIAAVRGKVYKKTIVKFRDTLLTF